MQTDQFPALLTKIYEISEIFVFIYPSTLMNS